MKRLRIKKKRKKLDIIDYIVIVTLSLFAISIIIPFYNLLMVSIVPQKVYLENPFIMIPKMATLANYKAVFSDSSILDGYLITLIVVLVGVPYNLFLIFTFGYALSKRKFWGKNFVLNMVIITMFFSGGTIPYFLVVTSLGLFDNILALILPYGINTFYMLIARNFFQQIPKSLEESAKIDGANEFRILWSIILPVSRPIMATIFLFCVVDRWNEWWNGLLFIQTKELRPLQLILRNIINTQNFNTSNMPPAIQHLVFSEGIKAANIFIVMLPIMLVYPFVQKHFIKGVLIGSIKS